MAQTSEASQISSRLSFRIGADIVALPAERIIEVIQKPALTRVPHGPAALAGIANLRGTALPVIALARLLGRPAGEERKVIVVDRGEPLGLLIDDVLGFTTNGETVQSLDIETQLQAAFPVRTAAGSRRTATPAEITGANRAEAVPSREIFTFTVAGQTYALPLAGVQRVVARPGQLVALSGDDAAVLGLINLDDQVLPVISLAELLGLKRLGDEDRIVVARFQETLIGLAVDAVVGVNRIKETAIDPVPAILRRASGVAEVEAIARADGGALISLLSPERLFGNHRVEQVVGQKSGALPMPETAIADGASEQFLLFELGDETYGLPLSAVDEVIRLPDDITRLPNAPQFVRGVVNLRGRPVPLIDQRQRFETTAAGRADKPRAVVVTVDGLQAGFVVDAVSQIIVLPVSALAPAPEFPGEASEVFDRVAHIEADGRMILLVDPVQLLSGAERDLVAQLAGAKGQLAKT